MTDLQGVPAVPGSSMDLGEALTGRWVHLADRPSPTVPSGQVGQLANRILVCTGPLFVSSVLPHMDTARGGLMLTGPDISKHRRTLDRADYDGLATFDPAAYEHYTATPDAPFWLPDDQITPPSLDEVLDQQLAAGAPVALTPTGFVKAGDTDSLKAAARVVRQLGREDTIFVVPVDISLVDRTFIRPTTAILADTGCPIGLILGKQFDPLDQSPSRIIPNLRNLAVSVPLMPLRTDFNAMDLVAHGAFAGAIGTGGRRRHTVDPADKPRSWNPSDRSPSVLFTDILSWKRGSTIATLYGARPNAARRCYCPVCQQQRLTRFLRQEQQGEAVAHAVAVWSPYVRDMLDAPTMRARAAYWRNLCVGAVREHDIISTQLNLVGRRRLKPQNALARWAELPAWPVEAPARRP